MSWCSCQKQSESLKMEESKVIRGEHWPVTSIHLCSTSVSRPDPSVAKWKKMFRGRSHWTNSPTLLSLSLLKHTQTQCLFQALHIHRTLQIILTYFIGVRINVPMADILFILFGFNQTSKSDGNFNVTRLPNINYSNTTSAFQWYFSLQSECVFSQSYSQTIKYTLSIQLPLTRSYSFFLWVYRFAHYTTTYTH